MPERLFIESCPVRCADYLIASESVAGAYRSLCETISQELADRVAADGEVPPRR